MSRTLALLLMVSSFSAAKAESHRFNLHIAPGFQVSGLGVGADGSVGFDWQFVRGVGAELRSSLLLLGGEFGVLPSLGLSAGMRFRVLEDRSGYANEPAGKLASHLAIAPHVGFVIGGVGGAFTIDTEVAYLFSIARPFQLGPFVRPFVALGFDGVTGGAVVGVAMSFGFGPEVGLDKDGDGVDDDRDRCPDTPPGSTVDARGCTEIPKKMVLDGITFRLNSADIEPSSELTLQRALSSLRDNPGVQVEIAGHTDDTGSLERNLQLSEQRAESVANWLAARRIDRGRLVTKGYGATKPVTPNVDEASRAKNRRIEFIRLDRKR